MARPKEPKEELRTRLSELKRASGLSFRQLSERSGVSSSAIGAWLKGTNLPHEKDPMLRFVRACYSRTNRDRVKDPQSVRVEGELVALLGKTKLDPASARESRHRKSPVRRPTGPPDAERRYRLEEFRDSAAAVPAESIANQPSRLLASAYQVVPFAYRDQELQELSEWRDDSSHQGPAVMLLHGPGGQGKTRLVMELAGRCPKPNWRVIQAQLGRPPTGDNSPGKKTGRANRVLIVVDYAERWPTELLRELLEEPLLTGSVARVLLIARTAGHWWERLTYGLTLPGSGTAVSEMELLPLTGPREELFRSARSAFAPYCGISDPAVIGLPGNLNNPAFKSILSIHMTALAAVDAYARNTQTPMDPARLSMHLLRHEKEYWDSLHSSYYGNAQIETSRYVIAQAVYVATLIGPLPPDDAIAAIKRAGVSPANADQVLRDHGLCYPTMAFAAGSDTFDENVLEPLRPDLLGEDFLALQTPGHAYSKDHKPDRWASTAVESLLGDPAQTAPDYARRLLEVLVETARRWPHIAEKLRTLLEDRPALIHVAGTSLLFRLADTPDIGPSLLETVVAALPDDSLEFWELAAAIEKRLASYRLDQATEEAERAGIYTNLSAKLARVRDYGPAVTAAHNAIASYRPLAGDSAVCGRALAKALTHLAQCYTSRFLSTDDAHDAAAEAVALWQRLGHESSDQIMVGESFNVLGSILHSLSRAEEALIAYQQSINAYEAATGENDRLVYVGSANLNMSIVCGALERWDDSKQHADAALRSYKSALDAGHKGGGLVGYAKTLHMHAELLWNQNERDQALRTLPPGCRCCFGIGPA